MADNHQPNQVATDGDDEPKIDTNVDGEKEGGSMIDNITHQAHIGKAMNITINFNITPDPPAVSSSNLDHNSQDQEPVKINANVVSRPTSASHPTVKFAGCYKVQESDLAYFKESAPLISGFKELRSGNYPVDGTTYNFIVNFEVPLADSPATMDRASRLRGFNKFDFSTTAK